MAWEMCLSPVLRLMQVSRSPRKKEKSLHVAKEVGQDDLLPCRAP